MHGPEFWHYSILNAKRMGYGIDFCVSVHMCGSLPAQTCACHTSMCCGDVHVEGQTSFHAVHVEDQTFFYAVIEE